MNYSRSIKKTSVGKRIIISWIIVLAIGLAIGFVCGYCISSMLSKNQWESRNDVALYGNTDDRISTEEKTSMEWMQEDLEFVPLEVDMDTGLQEFIFYLSAAYNIDYTFTMALIQKESNYKADEISTTGDYGLMQINVQNHDYIGEALGITDFLDPYENVKAGLWVLQGLFEKYESPEKVLMAYNMGENGAAILWEEGIFETNYTKAVLEIQDELEEMRHD